MTNVEIPSMSAYGIALLSGESPLFMSMIFHRDGETETGAARWRGKFPGYDDELGDFDHFLNLAAALGWDRVESVAAEALEQVGDGVWWVHSYRVVFRRSGDKGISLGEQD